jgi:pSer/pThr/pTyr-binding forkhead associated (FHA) protein
MEEGEGSCAGCGRPVGWGVLSCRWCGRFQARRGRRPDLPAFWQANQVSVAALKQSSIPVSETTYLAVGGGLGSFVWVDSLRICGVATAQIRVIGREETPYGRFQRLCRYSQIDDQERIRSDSGARPDNLWGWPGYALEEIGGLLRRGQWGAAARIAWQVFREPVLTETYAPRARMVFDALEREMKRIGWEQMARQGEVQGLRQTDDGRYAVLYTTAGEQAQVVIAPYLHLALGYAGIGLTAETQAYRHRYPAWPQVVQAYEAHEAVYEQLGRQGGTVVVRGRGIVASRVLQRLDEVRQRAKGKRIQVIHLMTAPIGEDTRYGLARRRRHYHRQVQPFNWPKAALGGDLRFILEQATPAERQTLFQSWGGTTTSNRRDWQEVVERGQREGWYMIQFGTVETIKANGRGRLVVQTKGCGPMPAYGRLVADFLLDCTGLNSRLGDHPLLAEVSEHYRLAKNESGRLVVTADFELKGLRNGGGQVFAAGIMAGGNAFAPVDGFLGLQYAAQRSVETLIRENGPGLQRLDGWASLRQWWRWWQGVEP